MKKTVLFILIMFVAVCGAISCARGSGCPAEKADTVKFDRKGHIKNSGGKTRLFK